MFLTTSLICFKCPSFVFFQTSIKMKWPHLFYSYVKIKISTFFMLKMNKKGASIGLDEILKKNGPICFLGNKK